jgi:hypothetical protein
MACAREQGLRRTELQIEPILPEGYGVLRALRAVLNVLRVAWLGLWGIMTLVRL